MLQTRNYAVSTSIMILNWINTNKPIPFAKDFIRKMPHEMVEEFFLCQRLREVFAKKKRNVKQS
jgi:hypothetical protein